MIRDAYKPERLAVSTVKELTVLPLGGKSSDEYRLTPVELYELAKRNSPRRNSKPPASISTSCWRSGT